VAKKKQIPVPGARFATTRTNRLTVAPMSRSAHRENIAFCLKSYTTERGFHGKSVCFPAVPH
jgi:hypothetical protein